MRDRSMEIGKCDDDAPTDRREPATATLDQGVHDHETQSLGTRGAVAPATLEDLQLPPRFEARRIIGRGAMGVVVEVLDRNLGREVAVKFLAANRKEDPAYRVRFLREARAAAMLRHPNIVTVHDVDPERDLIVMELVRGESLSARLRRERRLPTSEVRRIGRALLDALAVAHDARIVHRDVKPGNILIETSGAVKLVDFGIASFGDRDLTSSGVRIGTPAYMAPEQLRGRVADARADLYAVGATLFEAATGVRLHSQAGSTRDVAGAVLAATGDVALARAIERATAETPQERFADARAFARALEVSSPAAPTAGTDVPTSTSARASRSSVRRVATIAGLAIATAAIATLAIFAGRSRDHRPAVPSAAPVVAVLPFVDHTGEPRLDFAASGLSHIIGTELARISGVEVVGYYDLVDRLPDPAAPAGQWLEAARTLRADTVLQGELSAREDGIHLAIAISTLEGESLGRTETTTTVEGVPSATRAAARDVASAILGRPTPTRSSATRQLDVERALQLGIGAIERADFSAADDFLQQAGLRAPQLAEIHYYRALLDWWLSRDARGSIAAALAGDLEDAQRGFVEGLQLLYDTKQLPAIAKFRELSARFPAHRDIEYGLFEALFHGGRPAEAMTVYRRLGDRIPRFRLGLSHVLGYYFARGDEDGIAWAIGRLEPDDAATVAWQARALVARRDYAGAIELLRRHQTPLPATGDELERELVRAYVLAGQLELATDLADRWTTVDVPRHALDLLGLAKARGRADEVARWSDRALHATDLLTGEPRDQAWLALAEVELLDAAPHRLARIGREIKNRRLPGILMMLLIAGATGDRDDVEAARSSLFPEVVAIADALQAEWAEDWPRAAASWRAAIEHTSDGSYVIVSASRAARASRAAGEHAAVIRACDDVIRPRQFSWAWGSAVGPCSRWSAEAAAALGRPDEARRHWGRLLTLRAQASPGDPLVSAARAGLAASRPR